MLGRQLKLVREENGFSQDEIAKRLGKNQNTISSWEVGRTQPKLKDLHALCDLYNCTYEHLTGTKQHDAGDITLNDILSKLQDFEVMDLEVIIDSCKFLIEKQRRINEMEQENERLLMRVAEYQRQIEELKRLENDYREKRQSVEN